VEVFLMSRTSLVKLHGVLQIVAVTATKPVSFGHWWWH